MDLIRTVLLMCGSSIMTIILGRMMHAYDKSFSNKKLLLFSGSLALSEYILLICGYFIGFLIIKYIPSIDQKFAILPYFILSGKALFTKPYDSEGKDAPHGVADAADFLTLIKINCIDYLLIGLCCSSFNIPYNFYVFVLFVIATFIGFIISYKTCKKDGLKLKKILFIVCGVFYLLCMFFLGI